MLIRAHALIHQLNRKRDENGAIVATVDDYAAVYRLLAELMAEGIGKTVSEEVRETIATVEHLLKDTGDDWITVQAVAHELGLHESAVRRRVYRALEGGYLRNESKARQQIRLTVGEPLPEDRGVLPEPEQLAPETI